MELKNLHGFHFVDATDVERQQYVWDIRNKRTAALNQPKSRASKRAKKEVAAIVVCADDLLKPPPVKKKRVTKKAKAQLAIDQFLNSL